MYVMYKTDNKVMTFSLSEDKVTVMWDHVAKIKSCLVFVHRNVCMFLLS